MFAYMYVSLVILCVQTGCYDRQSGKLNQQPSDHRCTFSNLCTTMPPEPKL